MPVCHIVNTKLKSSLLFVYYFRFYLYYYGYRFWWNSQQHGTRHNQIAAWIVACWWMFFSSKKWSWKTNDETEKMTILSKKHQCINTFSTHLNETTPEKVTNEVFELFLLTGGTVKIESDEWQSLKEDITLRSGRASLPKSWSSKFAKKV